MSTEILPCPVCGKPCRRATALVGVKFFILCAVDCPYGGTSGDTEAAAIAAHNTVAAAVRDHAAVVAERDALRGALEAMVDAADHDSTPDEPEGWSAYTTAREALGVPVDVGTDAFSGREFYESYRCALRSKSAATAPKEAPDA